MTIIEFKPLTYGQRIPHILSLYEFTMQEKEGYIVFDGYYYVNDTSDVDPAKPSQCRFKESLPQTLELCIDGVTSYIVEVYKRTIIECTDKDILNPEFKPTDTQKIWFKRVL